MKTKLQKIAKKYSTIECTSSNYEIGGGLDDNKFASRRHEDALNDNSRLTLGKTNQLFAKATGLTTDVIKELIQKTFSDLEWHHAGKLPKSYGGGMKKTYFVNSQQIVYFAENFENILLKFEENKKNELEKVQKELELEQKRQAFLKEHAKFFSRLKETPEYSFITETEMQGKYGWFPANEYKYNLPIYYSGYFFESEELRNEYFKI